MYLTGAGRKGILILEEEIKSMDRSQEIETLLATGRHREIAERAGYTRQHTGGVILGTRTFTSRSLERIAQAAGVTEQELLSFIRRRRKILENTQGANKEPVTQHA